MNDKKLTRINHMIKKNIYNLVLQINGTSMFSH